ncbi:MAG: hypothetical protein LUD77_06385, partial [Clostridiales bacterium]|nr:hypothetical protein [Clostridiales bacterium]
HYNHKAYYDENKEQVLVIEDKAEVTAVAEILEDKLSFEVIRYNHHSLNGNIKQKKDILLELGSELESKRKLLESFNKGLSSDIFYILNNLNLRHNNCAKGTNNYKEAVALMQEDMLESWYDELYKMILLAFLELDHQERKKKVDQLKQEIEGVK